jgi:hypothetical protein
MLCFLPNALSHILYFADAGLVIAMHLLVFYKIRVRNADLPFRFYRQYLYVKSFMQFRLEDQSFKAMDQFVQCCLPHFIVL